MNIKNIIFDFGGVLVDWNPRYLYKTVFNDAAQMEYFLTHICTEEWNLQQDKDRTLEEGTLLLQKQFPDYADLINLFYDQWEVMLNGEITENVKLLPQLKQHYPLFGLTNWSAETFPIALNRFSFFKIFDGIVVSGEEKMIKPDKDIFHLLLNRYQIKASESLFIDDNINNIIAANEMGFHTIHIKPTIILEEELKKMGVL
ncbi:MAG: HAD family phosphatase [Flavobacteriaceae bacterium]|nr:HAD family phosphatase [Flavobacteriaceae bacterium]